jgi:hypothetical protein
MVGKPMISQRPWGLFNVPKNLFWTRVTEYIKKRFFNERKFYLLRQYLYDTILFAIGRARPSRKYDGNFWKQAV